MAEQRLNETFDQPQLDPRLHWQSEPSRWQLDPSRKCLQVWPDAESDFWQRTHYGFRSDNGHLLYLSANGDFELSTRLTMFPRNQYDQAGLMIWISPSCWIKTSIEYELEGTNQLGAVVTNSGYSDWSTQPIDRSINQIWLRMSVTGQDVIVRSSLEGEHWQQLRVAPLPERRQREAVRCGLYACSPKAAGFQVDFDRLWYDPT